jgi:hypothetical protein
MMIGRTTQRVPVNGWIGLLGILTATLPAWAGGVLQLRHGYFWDPATQQHFLPRGLAYQTWNPPVGADQSFEQVEYDLKEFHKLHANSVRVEFVWNQVEIEPGHFDFSKPDFLVAKAEELDLKLFVLIGFQYAPGWFPDAWKATNDAGEVSVVLNYEHPEARHAYSNYIFQVTARYRDRAAIGAWILGNEYAYFDLWNPDHRYLGFDPYSLASYRRFLAELYAGDIRALNANWGTSFPDFNSVPIFQAYPPDRNNPGYHDLIRWREHSVGQYVALGAVAAKNAAPNHLRTYSMIGGLFIGNDANYTCENAKTIVAHCRAVGAPLDFWSINNYASTFLGTEMRSGDFGVAKHQAETGLPVMISETGHSTTEEFPLADVRQAQALSGQMWETLMSGAIGAHIFTWNDRNLFNGIFIRERGFGIVQPTRVPKQPVYENVAEMFRRMKNLPVDRLFGASSNPPPDIHLFWPDSAKMGWPRANQENAMIWGALKRLGYQPAMLFDEAFGRGAYTNVAALLLSRCYQMDPLQLDRVASDVIARGIHVHANADLPGQFDAYRRPNPNWAVQMSQVFGLNVTGAWEGWDSGVTDTAYRRLFLTGVGASGPFPVGFTDEVQTWKIWHGVAASSGTTLVTHTGDQGTQPAMPALQIKALGAARTAVNPFALGDLQSQIHQAPTHEWDVRYHWLRAIYRDHFGLTPSIDLSGPGASYVIPDYRVCANGSILISLLNGHTNSASVTASAPALLAGKTVEHLTQGGILQTNSTGTFELNLAGDAFALLYAYASTNGVDQSLINPNPNKIWIESAPSAVWANHPNESLAIGFDTRESGLDLFAAFERVSPPAKPCARTAGHAVAGRGSVVIPLNIPDADLNDPAYASSAEGARYQFRAWLEKDGVRASETSLPVRLLWGVRPLSLPPVVTPGARYPITVVWQELPSWRPSESGLPLDRAPIWEAYQASLQYYRVVLELRSGDQLVAVEQFLTNVGSGQHTFDFDVPPEAAGPFTWSACLESAPGASHDLLDSFEDRDTGADPALFAPWQSYVYSESNNAQSFAEGVHRPGFDGNQAVFMVITNPPHPGGFSGFGLRYLYPQDWSLPVDSSEWVPYTFACAFREKLGLSCVVEFQVKDARDGGIHFEKRYAPGTGQWESVQASLDQFIVPWWIGHFDPTHVREIVINLQMLDTAATYECSIDHVRFDGPETAPPTVSPHEVWDGFEDREPGEEPSLLSPWSGYVYSERGNVAWLNQGISSQAANGGQAAFVTVNNPPNPGAYSGFGLYRDFTNEWSLPTDTNLWTDYVFSFDFREKSQRDCILEMQVKSDADSWIEFTQPYAPGTNGWDTIRADLSQFITPAGVGAFDPARVQSLAVNIRMLDPHAQYQALFDNIHFDTPGQLVPSGERSAFYTSTNDSARLESIRINASGDAIIQWWGEGMLQAAPSVTGPWSDLPEATSPYTFTRTGAQQFFRLRL